MHGFTKTIIAVSLFAAFGASGARAETPDESRLQSQVKGDVRAVERALRETQFDFGEVSKAFDKQRDQVLAELSSAAARVEALQARVKEIQQHFAALRSNGAVKDSPDQLESFCAKNNILDAGWGIEARIVSSLFEAEIDTFTAIQKKLEPVASEISDANSGWKLADVPAPANYEPGSESAKLYVQAEQDAQQKAHNARMRAQQRLYDAVTHAGWAATRISQMENQTLRKLAHSEAVDAAPVNAQACRTTVSMLRESRGLASTSHHFVKGSSEASDTK